MPVSFNRTKEVNSFIEENGLEKAIEQFNLSYETVSRYLRKYRELANVEEEKPEFIPRVLIFDIETKPLNSWTWSVWKQNVSHEQIASDWMVLTWSAKWLNHPEIYSGKITPEEVAAEDDSRIIKDIWKFIDAADVLVAHNGNDFDIPRLNTRFLIHGLQPPSPYQSIDTLKAVRRKFAFSHNKLDYIGQVLGFGGKLDTGGMKLWLEVLRGEQESIDKMEMYNKRDVTLLEEVYLKIRSWIPSHPNLALHLSSSDSCCPVCTSTKISWMDNSYYTTQVGKYSTFRCDDCGSIGRSRVSAVTTEKRKHLTVSPAR